MITSITSLRTWFYDQKRPYFTLNANGASRGIIARNESIEDLDQAWALLETNVMAQAEGGIANVKVFVTDKPKHNHGMETEARILPSYNNQQSAAIGALPSGYLEESKVAGLINEAREKWELENRIASLEAQLETPQDWIGKLVEAVERIGQTPTGQMIVAKLLTVPGNPAGAAMASAPMNGHPAVTDDGEEYDDAFYDNIEETAATLGISEREMAAKLAVLVKQNPELAKTLLQ